MGFDLVAVEQSETKEKNMTDNNDIVQIHIDGIHAKQSRIFGVVSVPRSSVVPGITPQCIELIYKHLFPRDPKDSVQESSTAAQAAKELGFRVLRLTTAEDGARHAILPES